MNVLRWLPLLALALGACTTTTTPVKSDESDPPGSIRSLSEIGTALAQAPQPVLLVLDIDDTLLTTPEKPVAERQFFGSDRWFGWQVGKRTTWTDQDRWSRIKSGKDCGSPDPIPH